MEAFIPVKRKHKKHGNKKLQTCKTKSKHQTLSNKSFEVPNVLEEEGKNIEA